MIEHIKARLFAKKFNIYTKKIDWERPSNGIMSGYWIYNNTIYFGHPLWVFFYSSQNGWFKDNL